MDHSEIWDDSALVDSWNAALEEYKRYHSIHARGEKVEDVLKTFQEEEEQSNKVAVGSTEADTAAHEDLMIDKDERTNEPEINRSSGKDRNEATDSRNGEGTTQTQQGAASRSEEKTSHGIPTVPPHLIGSVQDEGLKNLLMAWYYAGYYTGLYEGQQKAPSHV